MWCVISSGNDRHADAERIKSKGMYNFKTMYVCVCFFYQWPTSNNCGDRFEFKKAHDSQKL